MMRFDNTYETQDGAHRESRQPPATSGRFHASTADAFLHLSDSLREADEHRAADDAMSDVELCHMVKSCNRSDVQVIEAVPGVQFQPGGDRRGGRIAERGQLPEPIGPFGGPNSIATSTCFGSGSMKSATSRPASRHRAKASPTRMR